ncbi:MAG: type II toxin-antitoxin system YafQ family toxin [Oscillospiraceae bacterium]|nr:type II toxin-antitoxin system YafQ family toxin [Oscillospiraceae bacterium]MCD8016868.1 type II toxin-antitoxin system YafQ family toxin [Oscillospiraceae bacterium]MCD8192317.1 type II toxin-antitoxin system YafQ family toxin [Oscillospiraceae bacterium]
MAYLITPTKRFEKHFKSLTAQEKAQLKSKLQLLAENPLHPSLRTKRIQGTKGLFECSVNMDIRIIWYYEGDRLIILLDVGHHDILERI